MRAAVDDPSEPGAAQPSPVGAPAPKTPGDEPPSVAAGGGLKINTVIVSVAQRVNDVGAPDDGHTRTNYRADVNLSLAAGSFGPVQGTASAQLRAGYGRGVKLVPTYNGGVNSTTFTPADGARAYATVAQAYYEIEWRLGESNARAAAGAARRLVVLSAGKLDVFGFFDQNTVSQNENVQFLNNAFVHNPLLDSGGDIAADEYGYMPGARIGYYDARGAARWGASVGVFASGPAANFGEAPRRPFMIAQFEVSPRQAAGRTQRDNYRLYVWTNGRTSDFAGNEQRHSGVGFSADQRLGRDLSLFQRFGRRSVGHGTFDDAATVGLELHGDRWGRASDGIGAAFGWLKTSAAYRDFSADGSNEIGYRASGAERIVELYWRIRVNKWLQLTPDLQFVQRPGGRGDAPTARVLGLRARIAF